MVRSAILLIAFAVASTHSLAAASGSSESTAIKLREAALAGHAVAYSWVSELTTRIGPRPAGSANEQLAANWAANKFKEMGFENVQIESFPLTEWIRGPESAEIISPGTQPLAIAALGESPATPPGGIEGDVALFPTLDDLIAAPEGSLAGKLAVITRKLVRTQDTAGYAAVASARFKGPIEAARRGAIGFLIRSLGTDSHRIPHTGSTGFVDGHPVIPAFALSGPDADQIERLVHSGQTVRVRLFSNASFNKGGHSQNVIADVRGRLHPEEIVLLGAHLDSWDLGTGATDDGAGAAIVTAAGKLILDLPQRPRRTVRIVLFGAEEVAQPQEPFFLRGGAFYASQHASELHSHALISESDTGADRIYAARLPAAVRRDSDFARSVSRVLTPLGVLMTDQVGETGVDITPTVQAGGVPVFALFTDLTHYFDIHHTADDTLDKIDRPLLDQNVAAWAALTWLAADSEMNFRAASAPEEKNSSSLSSVIEGEGKK